MDADSAGRQNQCLDMKILITGGAGFIGSHLVEHHLNNGDSVLAIDDLSTGAESNIRQFIANNRFRFINSDLLEWRDLDREIARVDRIYHMAALVGMFRVLEAPVDVTRVNVWGTEMILDSVARSGTRPEILIASSSSVYGSSQSRELREDAEMVFSPRKGALTGYALSKLTNEIQAEAYLQAHGIGAAIPRLFNAVGPRQTGNYGFVLPRFIKQALKGTPLTVFGDGSQTRSFCDVRDTVAALDLLAGTPAAWAQPVNVGNTREITILELAEMVIERADSSSAIEFVPFDKAYGKHFEQITQRRPVVEKLKELTGFESQWSLEETIDELLEQMVAKKLLVETNP
jgi:UDP-glucose 4-epimerase